MKLLFSAVSAVLVMAACAGEAVGWSPLPSWPTTDSVSNYYPSAGGNLGRPFSDNLSYSENNEAEAVFERVEVGMPFVDVTYDCVIGEFLESPHPDLEIDWDAMRAEIFAESLKNILSGRTASNGMFSMVTVNGVNRVLATGSVVNQKLVWHYKNNTSLTNVCYYTIGTAGESVPRRLFWTSPPFNAPAVILPDNLGIQILGDATQFSNGMVTNSDKSVTYRKGIRYDKDAHTIGAYAEMVDNKWNGPEGQFVVAYFDSGDCSHYLGSTVVQVSGPDPVYSYAAVGDELKPQNQNYRPESGPYVSLTQSGQGSTDDPRSPYIYKQQVQKGSFHRKEGRVFAISETAEGESGAKKAEIYWEATDGFNVYWPFEQTCYHISWPTDAPVIAFGSSDVPGVVVPKEYSAKVLDWRVPKNCVEPTIDEGAVKVNSAGHFTLKLENSANTDFWFVPLNVQDVAGSNDFGLETVHPYSVGQEVRPRSSEDASRFIDLIDYSIPGYINAAKSPGRNWNVDFYHPGGSEDEGNAFSSVTSTVHFVNVTREGYDAEVWWSRSYSKDDMPARISFPAFPQRYKAKWPADDEVHNIVIASQLGSSVIEKVKTGKAIYIKRGSARASLDVGRSSMGDSSYTISCAVNPGNPDAFSESAPLGALGRVYTLQCGTNSIAMMMGQWKPGLSRYAFSINGRHFHSGEIGLGGWVPFTVVVATNSVTAYMETNRLQECTLAGDFFGGTNLVSVTIGAMPGEADTAASGVAVDEFRIWNDALSAAGVIADATNRNVSADANYFSELTFDDAEIVVGELHARDAKNNRYLSGPAEGFAIISPGAPCWESGNLPSDGGVVPEVYAQNDPAETGYNPNEEHAFTHPGEKGYTVWALRCDMNDEENPPYVLGQYASGGKGAMKVYKVSFENDKYRLPVQDMCAGYKLQPFHPLDLLPGGLCTNTYTHARSSGADSTVTYRDRTGELWVRRNGGFDIHYKYLLRPGFAFPADGAEEHTGSPVGFMSFQDRGVSRHDMSFEKEKNYAPYAMQASAKWPDVKSVPVMNIAQVLTKAVNGLPEVYSMSSCAVTYPCATEYPAGQPGRVVKLIDPTVERKATKRIKVAKSFPEEFGFKLSASGNCFLEKGRYYFTGCPPVVSDRFFIDINSAPVGYADVVLKGDYHDDPAGVSYLRVNSLQKKDCDALVELVDPKHAKRSEWKDAIESLYKLGDVEPSEQLGIDSTHTTVNIKYKPADHYALVATGEGDGFVTIIENDSPTAGEQGLPISMKTLYVTNSLYCDRLVVLEDENNKLAEKLDIYYTAPLGRSADGFTFNWVWQDAPESGIVPTEPKTDNGAPGGAWIADGDRSGAGKTTVTVGDRVSSLKDLVNRYWTMSYRANPGSAAYAVTDGRWSSWMKPTLAEGWVQRVINSVTPFAQRLSNLKNNKAEFRYTMPEQIGAPYDGDIALNNANLNNVGLMQLYRTVLNRAESLSIAMGKTDPNCFNNAVGKQLYECVARLADLNMILGAEAYSDAKNPTIACTDGTEFAGSVFCFANQVPTLLDEELALLRGRTKSVAPAMDEAPFYHRLMWNFTKGITQGELAYVNNYNLAADDGKLDASKSAAVAYPQGHGDAYGYYLSAVKDYYRLLRNPNFKWGLASMMEMLVSQHVVNMDYEEEDKFAECAYNMAKIGSEVVDLTARKQWKDNSGDIMSGYYDNPATALRTTGGESRTFKQAFGYGEWGCRSAYGALVNWAVANSLIPAGKDDAVLYFSDSNISNVLRRSSASLAPLGAMVKTIETKLNTVDSGLNPLGLSDNTVPFDISAIELYGNVGRPMKSHYEQIRERVAKALDNCRKTLAYANVYGSRIRSIENAEFDNQYEYNKQEAEFEKQLIAIFGRPYADDIGPGKTYEQSYTGPDIYHYAYMDLAQYGLSDIAAYSNTIGYVSFEYFVDGKWVNRAPQSLADVKVKTNVECSVSFQVTADGLLAKPKDWKGRRGCEGSIQAAYRTFLNAYVKLLRAKEDYDTDRNSLGWRLACANDDYSEINSLYSTLLSDYSSIRRCVAAMYALDSTAMFAKELAERTKDIYGLTEKTVQNTVFGLANTLPAGMIFDAAMAIPAVATYTVEYGVAATAQFGKLTAEAMKTKYELDNSEASIKHDRYSAYQAEAEKIRDACNSTWNSYMSLRDALDEVLAAQQTYRTILAQGETLLDSRKAMRTRYANTAIGYRYQDMYARVARNAALTKYSTSFDIAQRYVFELAKVYDYETGLLTSDPASGRAFLGSVIATRALGEDGMAIDSSVTDGGLYDIVARMDANWDVLNGRYGINNIDEDVKWFSLRYSNFRIDPGEKGDSAWKQELSRYWCDDVFADGRVARYCQRPENSEGTAAAVPGFIIPFKSSIYSDLNFFGRQLMGGEAQYNSSAYATRIYSCGIRFDGYDRLSTKEGLATTPHVYLVPIGNDYMRSPSAVSRPVLTMKVVDQVLPLPYAIGSTQLDDIDWFSTLSLADSDADSYAAIRRHAMLAVTGDVDTTGRLIGRSVWNDQWVLVIPATSLHSNSGVAKRIFLEGIDGGKGVGDISIGFRTYTRNGN